MPSETIRQRNALIRAVKAHDFPDIEFHLIRCPKYFARENLDTVYPSARAFADRVRSRYGNPSFYLLYTFQQSDYCEEAAPETQVTSPTKMSEDYFSELIQYAPAAVEWKDNSREKFFKFMRVVQQSLLRGMPASSQEPDGAALEPRFFLDWSDPATGLPMQSPRGASIFTDADAIEQLFSFDSVLIAGPGGGCRMISHPTLGLNVYPAAGVLVIDKADEQLLCSALKTLL